MTENLPTILLEPKIDNFPAIIDTEIDFLNEARQLLDDGHPAYSLLAIWSAAVHNLRRRVETYSIELFQSAVKDESGRKKYSKDGETINERWANVDELILINGTTKLGILSKKAGKALEMINWMRNHASPAHGSDNRVEKEDVFGLALILQKNLFVADMPDPGHSPSGLFEPIKTAILDSDKIALLKDQIKSFRQSDIRITFGFMLDMICSGVQPSLNNVKLLFNDVWTKSNDDLKKVAGQRYYSLILEPDSDESDDKGAKIRLLETLIDVDGIKYIPDSARANIYRHVAKKIALAKDSSYAWNDEEKAAKSLLQFGTNIPSIAFEDVYQEVLTVSCGNYWGRSGAYEILSPFFNVLNSTQLMKLARLFENNERVQSELFQVKPKKQAILILNFIKDKITIQSSKDELDKIIEHVEKS